MGRGSGIGVGAGTVQPGWTTGHGVDLRAVCLGSTQHREGVVAPTAARMLGGHGEHVPGICLGQGGLKLWAGAETVPGFPSRGAGRAWYSSGAMLCSGWATVVLGGRIVGAMVNLGLLQPLL